MKCSRILTITLLAALSSGVMTPTAHAAHQPQSAAAPTARTDQDVAREALARWKTTLKITDAQMPRFESIMIDSYRKMARAKASAAGDKTKLQDAVMAVFKEREAELAKLLTFEQMTLYRQHVHHAATYLKK